MGNLAEDLKINLNAVDDLGRTGAGFAALEGHTEVIRLLAATGKVDWNFGNNLGYTPLHLALFGGHFDVAAIIVQQDNVDLSLETRGRYTVANVAVYGGKTRCVKLLAELETCDSWNIPDFLGSTPLLLAISRDYKDILKTLLNCPRVDPNQLDKDGNSPVMKAVKEEKTDLAMLLVRCPRVDLGTKDRNGASLQRIAREKGLSDICDLIDDVKDARIGQLKEEKCQLQEEKSQLQEEKTRQLLEKIPECPVCLDQFQRDLPIISCGVGHNICGSCKTSKTIKVCPTCQRPFSGRAHDFENLVSDLWG